MLPPRRTLSQKHDDNFGNTFTPLIGPFGCRPQRFNGQPYSGINVLSLWMSALAQNFTAPIWMTFRQASELNAHVRKGEKGSLVVYANAITRTEHDDKTGQDVEREIPYMKGYTVFNVEQIEGLLEIYHAKAVTTRDPVARIDHAEQFFGRLGATIKHGGNRAYYAQELDYVQMPPFGAFRDAESYYATLAHELTHWTKHAQRLDRDFGRKSRGDEGHSREELVAEMGSAFVCADLELHQEPREENAAYIATWLEFGLARQRHRRIQLDCVPYFWQHTERRRHGSGDC